jgi:hypothetical protein
MWTGSPERHVRTSSWRELENELPAADTELEAVAGVPLKSSWQRIAGNCNQLEISS